MLCAWTRNEMKVEQTGFETRFAGVWQRWLQEVDLFVVGLERRYEKGVRAEGVTVAEMLWKARRKVLIVGSDCNAGHLASPFYWDVGSGQALLGAVAWVIDNSQPRLAERTRLQKYFARQLAIPTGH